jgi:hypothetical protein
MGNVLVDGLPSLAGAAGALSLRTQGMSAFVRSPRFISRIALESGIVAWVFERELVALKESIWKLPRRIRLSGSNLWKSESDHTIAELTPTEDGGVLISGRNSETGRHLWDYPVLIPEAASWAEPSPAWPGAQTEEIEAFLANDPTRLVVCMSRQSRRSCMYSPSITVNTLPPQACQLDAIRLDTSTGKPIWQGCFPDVGVGITQRGSFQGIWSCTQRVGVVDFETGTNSVLHEYPHTLGWPVRDGLFVAVPWHSEGQVGIAWLDERGNEKQRSTWQHRRVNATYLHQTESGLAMQINEQTLCWLGEQHFPSWEIRAKPYIYRVHRCSTTDVYVGTDGRGGRLLAFDAASGQETLSLKPPSGGAGTLAKVPEHQVLVAKFWTSRRDYVDGSLLVLSMQDGSHRLDCGCRELLGTWQHGAVCVAGENGERLAIVDIR